MIRLSLDDARWRQFVAAQPEALPYHHPAWAALLAETYGYPGFALALAGADGQLRAGLPVLEVSSPVRGTRWVALPFTDACPVLGTRDAPDVFTRALEIERVRRGVIRVDVHAPLDGADARVQARAVVHTRGLSTDTQAVFRSFQKSRVQHGITRAERDGVRIRRACDPADLTEVFYGLHLQTRRRQGVPVQPKRFFRLLWQRIIEPGLGFVLIAEASSVPIAAAVFLAWQRTVIYKYGASSLELRRLRPNHLVMWSAIRAACEEGYERFDFGRSDLDNQGLRSFKAGWGTEEHALAYSTLGASSPPAGGAGLATRVLGGAIRRSPIWVCRALGEWLYRYAA
jgi:CelD/BcsL family acetyltransferase involved in cellulose biosynthesis